MHSLNEVKSSNGYVISSQQFNSDGYIYIDLTVITENSVEVIRIFNIELEFYVAIFPTLSKEQFERFLNKKVKSTYQYIEMIDRSYFNFNEKYKYYKIYNHNVDELRKDFDILQKFAEDHYRNLDLSCLTPDEELFYYNTETPFRLTTNMSNALYMLPTKYNIPLIGGIVFDRSKFEHPLNKNMPCIDCNGLNFKYIDSIKPNNNDLYKNIVLLSYDIETYNDMKSSIGPELENNYVFCIGIGLFHITDVKPFRRICIISKPFNDNIRNTEIIKDEYGENSGETEYIFVKDEKDLLEKFFENVKEIRPQIICGFNNFEFDDEFICVRSRLYDLENEYLSCFTIYSESDNKPKFERFSIKIDAEEYSNNKSVRSVNLYSVDVRKELLKEDPKRFTQQQSGSLNAMLAHYGVKNPFTNESLSKTDMPIPTMFKYWDEDSHIYEIAKYCMQDAWITGTLLIFRNKLLDLIELGSISCTTYFDSLYHATGLRVAKCLLSYVYKENTLYQDSPYKDRRHEKALGGKTYDRRVIIGGAVRNIVAAKIPYVVALDFSSMYPSQKEASNIDTSSRVDERIIKDPKKYGIQIIKEITIDDMYGRRKIFFMKKSSKMLETSNEFVVEEFFAEFRLDVKRLELLKNKYISTNEEEYQKEFMALYPEGNIKGINEIPETITKRLYFVQSPRDSNNKILEHYSLKERMLTDLRNKRAEVRKIGANCTEKVMKVRYESMQLAIKIIMNSEYGTTDFEDFANYDPDIAAAVTFQSRRLIKYLTDILQTKSIVVDERFINDNSKYIDLLKSINCIELEEYHGEIIRYNSLRRLFNTQYEKLSTNIFELKIKPSTVAYQDTDSNYYFNKFISEYYLKDGISPLIVNNIMKATIAHNNLIANLIKDLVNRSPISLSFEGAFLVCRYLNRKKRYFGVVYSERMKDKMPEECYNNGILIEDYSNYWKSGQFIHPLPNGDYIEINKDKLLHKRVNYIDYVKSQNVKVVGVDLTRRDQFLFINFFHLLVLQKDLRLMEYFGDNYWESFDSISMKDVIVGLFNTFQNMPKYFENISEGIDSKIEMYEFTLIDFSKSVTNRPNKNNACKDIISRLTRQNKTKYIPSIMEKVQYVVIFSENMENQRLYGRAYNGKMSNNYVLVEELLEELRESNPKESYIGNDYDKYINALAICRLNFKYYFEKLVKSMSLYLLSEEYPSEMTMIDNGEISEKDSKDLVSKLQDKLVRKYRDIYFPSSRSELRELTQMRKMINLDQKPNKELIFKVFPDTSREITLDQKSQMEKRLLDEIEKIEITYHKADKIYRHKLTNKFTSYKCRDQVDVSLNNMKEEELLSNMKKMADEIIKYKTVLKSL
jgi:DNA polymerase elongation subunit (family B)